MTFLRSCLPLACAVSAFAAAQLACSGETPLSAAAQAEQWVDALACAEVDGIPTDLRCAGLYDDFSTHTVSPAALAFQPAFQLWSDAARKSRWIVLPPGSKIDVQDMNGWVFPIGTKLFKEFRLPVDGKERRIETRMLWKRGEGQWVATKYVWSDDETSAVRTTGAVRPLAGSTYEVPDDAMCGMCHRGGKDQALGFSAVLLAAPEATGTTYDDLVARDLLRTNAPEALPAKASLQIPGEGNSREALGRLHVGCGLSCHNKNAYRPFQMRIDVSNGHTPDKVEDTNVYKTGVGRPSMGYAFRIKPGDEEQSAVFARMRVRGAGQMPPVGTRVVDEEALAIVKRWIRELPQPPY